MPRTAMTRLRAALARAHVHDAGELLAAIALIVAIAGVFFLIGCL